MTVTIGLVANVYQEANALPGWLETHTPFFDDVRVLHAGPGGAFSDDGTMEILEKWRVPVLMDSINDGFGAVRTRAIRSSPCDWVMLLDADERFYPLRRVLTCKGTATPQAEVDAILRGYDFSGNKVPDWDELAKLGSRLLVDFGATYDQGSHLREILEENRHHDAIATIRRHWHDLAFQHPTQNWHLNPDWQLRLVRNSPDIYFDAGTRMHEQLVGANQILHADMVRGPFFDHFHFHFKRMEAEQRRHDIKIYDAIHTGQRPPQTI